MNSKLPIGWIFAAIATLVMGALVAFSLYFQSLGKWAGAIGIALLLIVLWLVIVFFATKLKKVSMPIQFKKASGLELLALVGFLVVVLASGLLMSHFFVVMGRQQQIKADVNQQIEQIDGMINDYNEHANARIKAYDMWLTEVERNRNNDRATYVSSGLAQYDKDALVIVLTDKLMLGEDMQSEIDSWKEHMRSRTNGLGIITLMPRVSEISEKLEGLRSELISRYESTSDGLNGGNSWDYPLSVNDQIFHYFERAEGEALSWIALLVALVLGAICLLPYIAANRDGRHRGAFWELTHSRENDGNNVIGI